jgi:hypothetical protein
MLKNLNDLPSEEVDLFFAGIAQTFLPRLRLARLQQTWYDPEE